MEVSHRVPAKTGKSKTSSSALLLWIPPSSLSLLLPRSLELRRYPNKLPCICSKASALCYSALQPQNSPLLSLSGVLEKDLMTWSHIKMWIIDRPSSHFNSALSLAVKSSQSPRPCMLGDMEKESGARLGWEVCLCVAPSITTLASLGKWQGSSRVATWNFFKGRRTTPLPCFLPPPFGEGKPRPPHAISSPVLYLNKEMEF